MPAEATQIAASSTDVSEAQEFNNTPTREQIAALAYRLWQERGSPEGSPEADWFDAEKQLLVADTEA